MSKHFILIFVFAAVLFLSACGSFINGPFFDVNLRVSGSGGKADLTVNVGTKVFASSTLTYKNKTDCNIVGGSVFCDDDTSYSETDSSDWTSSNESVATINADSGTIETLSPGRTEICARYEQYGGKVFTDCGTLTVTE